MTERLWAPWRHGYLVGDAPKVEGCLFCVAPAQADDRTALIVERRSQVFVILNRYPYNNGHLMVVPYQHTASMSDLNDATMLEMMQTVARWAEKLQTAMRPHGFNVGMNLGAVAGAGIADHLHMHIVPRWGGDTNFMPVLGDVRVMGQSLESAWDVLTAS